MKKNFKIFVAGLMIIAATFSSCSKEGPVGPAGKNGNANVVSSSSVITNWNYNSSIESWVGVHTYPAITQSILDKGAVLAYLKDGNSYYQMPFTFYDNPDYATSLKVETYLGGLSVHWADSDLNEPIHPGNRTIKVVVISASELKAHPNVDFKNYNAVKKAFNVVD